jgi:hypothetical protein
VFDAFKPDYVERAFAHAKGNDVAALEVMQPLSLAFLPLAFLPL